MAIKTQYVVYTAKNFSTGLTDVTANVFRNGVSVPVATGLSLSEISAANCPGRYLLTLTPTQINSFGGVGTYKICIDSASRSAPATAKLVITVNDNDDLDATLQILDGKLDTITNNLAALQTDTTSIKGTVEDSNSVLNSVSFGNAALKALIDQVTAQVSNIQNATRTLVAVQPELVKPTVGVKQYKVEISIFNVQGFLQNPDAAGVSLTLKDAAGNDRGNLFVGISSGALVIPVGNAANPSAGIFTATIEIANNTAEEALTLFVDYTETDGDPMRAQRAVEVVANVQAAGFAQETTAQSILTDTQDIKPRVQDIQSVVNDATFGNSAIKALLDAMNAIIGDTNTVINDAGFGLAAIAADLSGKASQVSVDNIANDLVNNVKGAGFDNATDSLKAISDRTFSGGTAI